MSAGAARTRADAVRNSERVLRAAVEVLAEKGAEAGIPEIALRAGVGKGTVYRCYPTKEDLVGAVVADKLRTFTALIEAAAARPDAWEAFVELLRDSAERQAADCTFTDGLSYPSTHAALVSARVTMHEALGRLMARAQVEGRMRRDVTSEDVSVLFAGMARRLRADGNRDPAVWRRYAGLVADAMRAY
jgi:AcrR family transcriptional regulator